MIQTIIKNRQKQAREHFKKALYFFENGQYQYTNVEFKNAFRKNKNLIQVLRKQVFEKYEAQLYQEALVLGRCVLNIKKNDYELANLLGNCDRRIGNIEQAIHYFKYALKQNKTYKTALYNMAAAMGDVELYDENVKKAIDAYCRFKTFLVPDLDYQNNPNVLNFLTSAVTQKKYYTEIENMQEGLLESELRHDTELAKEIQKAAIVMKQKFREEVKFHSHDINTRQVLKEAIKQNWKTLGDTETHKVFWDIFNLGMEIISQNQVLKKKDVYFREDLGAKVDLQLAKDCLKVLKKEGCRFKYMEMTESLIGFIEKDIDNSLSLMLSLLEREKDNRYYNINLGLMYKMLGKPLLSYKYLARGAKYLMELEGHYNLSEIIQLAEQKVQIGQFEEALKLYQIASLETENITVLENLGAILLNLEQFDTAVTVFYEILRINPNDETARQSIKTASKQLQKKAEQLCSEKKYSSALQLYLAILDAEETIEILEKATDAAIRSGQKERSQELTERLSKRKDQKRSEEVLEAAEKYLSQGKVLLTQKKYMEAIESFNTAFRLHADKSTYSILSYLYKKLNYKSALNKLILKWEGLKK